MSASVIFSVNINESTLGSTDGSTYDNLRWDEPSYGPDFASLAEARAWATEQASRDKLEIVTDTRYGNGTVSRNVYEIVATTTDEDGDVVSCSYEGEPWEDSDNEVVDVLDLHPEVKDAWKRANGSFCKWLDYADHGMGFLGFRDSLEAALGEGWGELEYITWR